METGNGQLSPVLMSGVLLTIHPLPLLHNYYGHKRLLSLGAFAETTDAVILLCEESRIKTFFAIFRVFFPSNFWCFWHIKMNGNALKYTQYCVIRPSSLECLLSADLSAKCWLYKATLHPLLPAMVCFDSCVPGELLHLIPARVTQDWEHCWWRTTWRCFCLWRNSLQEAGSVLLQGKALRLPVPHNLTPNLNSIFLSPAVQASWLFCFTNLFKSLQIPTFSSLPRSFSCCLFSFFPLSLFSASVTVFLIFK